MVEHDRLARCPSPCRRSRVRHPWWKRKACAPSLGSDGKAVRRLQARRCATSNPGRPGPSSRPAEHQQGGVVVDVHRADELSCITVLHTAAGPAGLPAAASGPTSRTWTGARGRPCRSRASLRAAVRSRPGGAARFRGRRSGLAGMSSSSAGAPGQRHHRRQVPGAGQMVIRSSVGSATAYNTVAISFGSSGANLRSEPVGVGRATRTPGRTRATRCASASRRRPVGWPATSPITIPRRGPTAARARRTSRRRRQARSRARSRRRTRRPAGRAAGVA